MHTVKLKENNVETGLMRIRPNRLTRSIRVRPSVVSIVPCFDGDRAQVVEFIENRYRETYDARVRVDYPNLISVRNADGRLVAAAGFRFAGREPLFLEHYTGSPIETMLATRRGDIVEIGNLASDGGGVSIYLFTALASYLHTVGISRAVITGTRSLERRLSLLGLDPQQLCRADPGRVADTDEHWASYYATRPYVLAGKVDLAVKRLREVFGNEFFVHRTRLFPRLHSDAGTA